LNEAPPEITSYSIEKPARIALYFVGATSDLERKRYSLPYGNATKALVLESGDRTRLVVNLVKLVPYETRIEGNNLFLLVGQEGTDYVKQTTDPHHLRTEVQQVADVASRISDLQFQRAGDGEGRLTLQLTDPGVDVNVFSEGGIVKVEFLDTTVAERLLRRYDVTDFATPVNSVDVNTSERGATLSLKTHGDYDYLAYQTDNEYVVSVKPLSKKEAERRKNEFTYVGDRISLNFQDIEVRSVLQLIADFTGLNLVASDTVDGRITLRLQNVPWDQALELILKTKGLDKRKVGNVLLVAPADEIAAREQLELESQKQIASLAPLRTQYVNVNYANAAEIKTLISGAEKEVGSLLSERGSVVVDKRTNTLIIQDTQARLNDIGDLIEQLDIPVQQVLIEARVVVASNDVSKEFGVRWGGLGYDGSQLANEGETSMFSGRLTSLRQLHYANIDRDDDGSLGEIEEFNVDTNNDLIVDLGVESSEASRFAVGFTSLASGLIELELSAVGAEGHGELVATPKVLTADQQPAVIAAGQRVPYETATSSGATAVEFIDAELRLEVTPHITPDGNIIMTLKVFNDAISGFVADTPVVDTNRVETSVLVSDGETVVLGGIFQQEKRNSVAKTPFLGDLPWIGKLFSRTTKVDDKQELLIFITPRLMKDALANR